MSAADDHRAGVAAWSSTWWREQAVSWLDDQLADLGIERTGEVEQPHLRPWATVLRAPTNRGPVWLKATGPGNAFEVRLYELLHHVVPDRLLTPLAVDVARAWIVLPDGGPPLGERLSGTPLVDALMTALPQYGQLQRDLTPYAEDLLALGVTDMRPAVMPARFGEALRAVGDYVEGRGQAADRVAYHRVTTMSQAFTTWCDQLAAAPGRPSLDHNDLHPWNILVSADAGAGQVMFYDWGDSVLAHPFASMLVALGYVQAHVLQVNADDPRVVRLRDAYLEVFSDLAPHAELVGALELACRVGKVARALTWHRALNALGYQPDDPHGRAPLETLFSLLDDSYLGGA